MKSIRKSLSKSLLLVVILVSSVAQPMKRQRENDEGSEQVAKMRKTAEQIKVREGYEGQTIKFKWSDAGDNDWMEIPAKEALHSIMIKLMLEDMGLLTDKGLSDISADVVIPLHNVGLQTLTHIRECLEIIEKQSQKEAFAGEQGLAKYVEEIKEPQALHDLYLAANYVDIKLLLDVCAQAWVKLCSSEDVDEDVLKDLNEALPVDLSRLAAQHCKYHIDVEKFLFEAAMPQDDQVNTLNGHTSWVNSVCFSPDGKKLASGSLDNTIKLWDIATGKEIVTLNGHTSSVNSVCFSPDGKKLASGSSDNTIKLWDVAAGTCIATLKGHTRSVYSVCFSPDGTKLASGSADNMIKLWDVDTRTCITTLNGHTNSVLSVCFSPDGKKLASGSVDNTIKLWDVDTRTCIATLNGHTRWVNSVCFSPDGKKLASGSVDNTIKLWDVDTRTCIATLKSHTGLVESVCFSLDGIKLASGSLDNTIKLWRVGTGEEIVTLNGYTSWVASVCFSSDGTKLASGSWDKMIKLWNVGTGKEIVTLNGHTNSVISVCFSPDSTKLASGSRDDRIKLWDVAMVQAVENFLKQKITLAQSMFLKLVMQEHQVGQVFNWNQENQEHFIETFSSLPDELRKLLVERKLVTEPVIKKEE